MDDIVVIKQDDAHHITRVMRFNVNDKIICSHPEGSAAICQITNIYSTHVEAKIIELLERNVELPVSLTIAQGLPKGDKLDWTLQKGTELGAGGFIPFQAERSVVRWNAQKFNKKKERFTKIIKEASEQSHRNKQPTLHPVMSLKELLTESQHYDVKLFPYEEEAKRSSNQSISQVFSQLNQGERVLVCIGPEGGFSKEEVRLLEENEFQAVRIGPRILRTETAALYVLASLSYHLEELKR